MISLTLEPLTCLSVNVMLKVELINKLVRHCGAIMSNSARLVAHQNCQKFIHKWILVMLLVTVK